MTKLPTREKILGLDFEDKTLLLRALTHRSYLNENPDFILEDNERLEFLGDAVLDFLTAEYLYHRFPEMQEGELTGLRAALVRTESLASLAHKIRLGSCLYLGHGEEAGGGRRRAAVLCGAFEALVGALYLDQGFVAVEAFVKPLFDPEIEHILAKDLAKDPKSLLQELSQAQLEITPRYCTISESGPDHAKEFVVEAIIGQRVYGRGVGRSKQNAARAAAQDALVQLRQELNARLVADHT
ncbi:MAG: ribonuclease III [Anaerolineae bacterium]|nr:MAG: ribonuclease III [Anaerolineae bacterium]